MSLPNDCGRSAPWQRDLLLEGRIVVRSDIQNLSLNVTAFSSSPANLSHGRRHSRANVARDWVYISPGTPIIPEAVIRPGSEVGRNHCPVLSSKLVNENFIDSGAIGGIIVFVGVDAR